MKVLDLQCQYGHVFEGWFGSEDDFQSQLGRTMVECPLCGSHEIAKRLSAPRLNLSANARAEPSQVTQSPPSAPAQPPQSEHAVANMDMLQMQQAWMKMVHHVMQNTEDVGADFAKEARKMHYGETEQRSIRGQATADESHALMDEGIQVVSLPVPQALKGPVH